MGTLNLAALIIGYAGMAVGFFGALLLLKELTTGFVRACSLTRFYLAVAKRNRRSLPKRKFPMFFVSAWWRLTTSRPTIQGSGGYWKGVGDWKAYKESKRL